MAELLVKGVDSGTNIAGWTWLRGHPVVVMDDGHEWGAAEQFPAFAVFKFPGVPVATVQRYLADDGSATQEPTMRRIWQIRWADLPLAARNLIKANGGLTIMVAAYGYTGPYDYTWAQVKTYWHNNVTNTNETADL